MPYNEVTGGPEKKRYVVQIPGKEHVAYWDAGKYEANRDNLFEKYPDAQVTEFMQADPNAEINDADQFVISIPGKKHVANWDGKKMVANRDKLLEKYPDAQIQKINDVTAQRNRDFAHQYEYAQDKVADATLPESEKQQYTDFVSAYSDRYDKVKDLYGRKGVEAAFQQRNDDINLVNRYEATQKELDATPDMPEGMRAVQQQFLDQNRENYKEAKQRTSPPEEEEPVTNFFTKLKQNAARRRGSILYSVGEMIDINARNYTGPQKNDSELAKEALAVLEERERRGEMGVRLREMMGMDTSFMTEEQRKAYDHNIDIERYIAHRAGGVRGDAALAKQILEREVGGDKSGQKMMAQGQKIVSENNSPGKGIGAKAADLADLAVSGVAAIGAAYLGHPEIGAAIGNATFAAFAASSAGESMMAAREAGANDEQTIAAGATSGAIMYLIGRIPFLKGIKGAEAVTSTKAAQAVSEALSNPAVRDAVQKEAANLQKEAAKAMGMTVSQYTKDFLAHTASSAASFATMGGMEALVPLIYENPDDYPVLNQVAKSVAEGAVDGAIMGALFGGVNTGAAYVARRNHLKSQMAKNGGIVASAFDFSKGEAMVYDAKTKQFVPVETPPESGWGEIVKIQKNPSSESAPAEWVHVLYNGQYYMVKPEAIIEGSTTLFKPADLEKTSRDTFTEQAKSEGRQADTPLLRGQIRQEKEYTDLKAEREAASGNVSEETQLDVARADAAIQGRREAISNEIQQRVGRPFWRTSQGDGTSNVEVIRYQDGEEVYIVGRDEQGFITVDGEGKAGFVDFAKLNDLVDSGEATRINSSLDDYLDTKVAEQDMAAEQERMAQEQTQNLQAVQQRVQQEGRINVGTPETELWGTVQEVGPNGVAVLVEGEKEPRIMDWKQVATSLGMPLEGKSDADLVNERLAMDEQVQKYNDNIPRNAELQVSLEIGDGNTLPVTYTFRGAEVGENEIIIKAADPDTGEVVDILPQMVTNLEELANPKPAEPVADVQGEPVPGTSDTAAPVEVFSDPVANELGIPKDYAYTTKKGNVVVDGNKLWADNPKLWAEWNDRNPNRAIATKDYLAAKQKEVDAAVKKARQSLEAEATGTQNPDRMEELREKLDEKIARQSVVQGLREEYEAAEKAAKEAEKQQAKIEAEKQKELQKKQEMQREMELSEPMTLNEVVANWLSGVKKGSLNKEDFKRELGLGEPELKRFFPYWGKKGSGMTVTGLAEAIAADDTSGLIPQDSSTAAPDINAVRNAIIDVMTSSQRPRDLANYTKEENLRREAEEQAYYEGLAQQERVEEAESTGPVTTMTDEDMPAEFFTDSQGNPLNDDGTLAVTPIASIDELTDEDFTNPSRTVALPALPANVDAAIGVNGKPVIIKKNIFERNARKHADLTPDQSRQIINDALYKPQLYGQNQKASKPFNWVVINTIGSNGENRIVLLEIDSTKDNVEIVHWHYIDERGIEKIKRQAEREDGQLLILPSVATEEVGALSDPTLGESSDNKVSNISEESNVSGENFEQDITQPEKTPNHPARLREAYESGNANEITEAQNAIRELINGSKDIDRVNTTAEQAKTRRKKAEKGSAEYKTNDFIAKAASARVKQLRDAGMRTFAERRDAAMEVYFNLDEASESQLRDALAYFESQSQYEADRGRAEEVRRVLDERSRRESDQLTDAQKNAIAFVEGKTPEQVAAEHEAERQKPLKERVKEWEERTGVTMEVLESRDQVTNKSAQKAIDGGQNPTGWFDPRTGKTAIYLPNIKDASEIDKTYMHEVVAHKGVRGLLGEDGFNELMDHVWNDLMTAEDRKRWLDYNSHLEGSDEYLRRAAADEFMAHLAEDVDSGKIDPQKAENIWTKIASKIQEILNKLGLQLKLTVEDLKEVIKASLANLERTNAKTKAQAQTGHADTNPLTEAQKKVIAFVEGKASEQVDRKAKATEPKSGQSANADKKIDDFGQKIGGARKDQARARIKDSVKLTVKDLSELKDPDKILSRKQIAKYVAEGQMTSGDAQTLLAANMAVRSSSGLDSYKSLMLVKYRDMASAWERGEDIAFEFTQEDEDFILQQYSERIQQMPNIRESIRKSLAYHEQCLEDYRRTYEALDYPNTARDIKSAYISQGRVDGRFWVKGSYSASRGYPFSTFDEAVVKMKSLYPEKVNVDKEAKKAKDSGDSKTGHLKVVKDELGYFRVKSNLIPGQIFLSRKFYNRKDAEAYLNDNAEALVEKENKMAYALMGSNIGMVQREGQDYRGGKDVTEKDFMETFNPKGVEFGNWVPQAERQEYLNKTYDAIMDFCQVVGISPKAFFLGSRLGIGFGSRGKGGALAHYESLKEVINLTRMKGAGSLAHEWFHALDNYLAKQKTGNTSDMATDTRNVVRQEVADAFTDFVKAMNALDYSKRSHRAGAYWGEVWERAARLFADYTYNELGGKGIVSPLLARMPDEVDETQEDFILSVWPYATKQENATMKPYFDRLFAAIQEEEGTGVLFRKDGDVKQQQLDIINASNPMTDDYHTGIRSVDDIKTWDEVVAQARQEAEQGGWTELAAYPDITNEMIEKAGKTGAITVYSSYPIENGVFVTPSRKQAEDYAGEGEVYSKTVPTANVAWISTDEGQYAEVVPGEKTPEERINEAFNNELQEHIKTGYPEGHTYQMGRPGAILQSTGIPDVPIQLQASVINEKSNDALHPYDIKDLKDLPRLIQRPWAVFEYGDKNKAQNILIGISKGEKQFIVGLSLRPTIKSGRRLEINSVRNVFPKDNAEWLNWIKQGKALRIDAKEEIQAAIEALRINPVDYLNDNDLNYIANVVKDFENPTIPGNNNGLRFRKANQTQNGFISNAEVALDKIKMEKATPEQWVKMLEKEGGLKAGEDKWIGLSDWLKESDKKTLTKDEIGDFIEQNRIQIEEEHYGEADVTELQREFDEIYDGIIDGIGTEDEDEVIMSPRERAWEELNSRYHGGDDFNSAFYLDDRMRIQVDNEDAAGFFLGKKPINYTRLNYTTEGLTNKQEIALTVPTIDPWNESDEIHFGDAGNGRAVAWVRFGDTNIPEDGGAKRAEFERIMADNDRWYKEHPEFAKYGIGDEAMNRESDERTARQRTALAEANAVPNSKKVLVIDEIQSKRHQEGREKGYQSEDLGTGEELWDLMKKYNVSRPIDLKDSIDEAERQAVNSISSLANSFNIRFPKGWTKEEEYTRNGFVNSRLVPDPSIVGEEDADWYNRMCRKRDEARLDGETVNKWERSAEGVPRAPFEKNWHELAMKRMLRLAAEEGYDYVAWTTGDQQAERYDIGQVVNSIGYEEPRKHWIETDNSREFVINKQDGNKIHGRVFVEGEYKGIVQETMENSFGGKPLSDVLGKALANQIIEAEGRGEITGEGLRIGAEGMKGFYDDILPRFMNKYGKKWGVKVQDINLPGIGDAGTGLTMHSIDVTPEMKESVMEGQVMFRKATTNTEDGETISYESMGGLPAESKRTSLVERTYKKTGAFSFTGKEKIESAADVAYIFKELETEAVENSFIVFVKDGKPTILHTGIGTINQTEIDSAPMVAGLKDFTPDKIYMVHNHPSGRVEASTADGRELDRLQMMAGDIPVEGIIIDTVSGEYGVFDKELGSTLIDTRRGEDADAVPLEVLTFNKMVFSPDYHSEIGRGIANAEDVAAYLSAHRLGEGEKLGALLLNQHNQVVGNLVFNENTLNADNAETLANDAVEAAVRSAANRVILFGDMSADKNTIWNFKNSVDRIGGGNVRWLDAVKVEGNHTRSLAEGTLKDEEDFWADQLSDQEKSAIGNKPVTNVEVDSSKVKLPTNRKEAIDIVGKMSKPFVNTDQGKEFVLSNTDIKHIATQDNSHQKIDVKCLGVVDQIIKNAVKIGNDKVPAEEVGHTRAVEIYYCPVKIDSKQYSARLVVKEYENRGVVLDDLHLYDIAAKERKPVAVSRGTGTKALTPSSASGSGYKVKDLIHSTKINDQKLLGLTGGFLFDSAIETDEYGDAEVRFRKVTDKKTLEKLNSEPTIKVYRAMQEIDGKLYPPMAAKVEGKMQEPIELGVWEEAVERPDLADAKGNFTLNKGNGKSLKARYNPYIHTSRSPLNDQFTSAYDRPNLVTVEVEVPESELTSGYKAEKAKDAVGEMTWHSGPVSGKLPEGKKRKVILSRWDRPLRIVPDSEVAERIAELLEGENLSIPYNTVTPSLREELEKRGVQISDTPSGTVKGANSKEDVLFRKSQELVTQSREGGLAGVIGDENAAELYNNIYRAIPKEIREKIVGKAGDGFLFSEATKDVIAEAVEKGDKTGIAGLAANMLRDYVGDLDERTARYILWRGTRKEADDDLIDTVNDIALQRKLQVGEFADPVRFRLRDNIEENQGRAESMADDAKQALDEQKAAAKKDDSLTTIKAMSLQKEYDKKTVDAITTLAKNIIKDQNIDTLNRREIARLLGIVNISVGKSPKTVKKNADALVGLVIDHLIKSEETKLGMLARRKASKVNQTGVEVQGELDVRGQNVLKAYKAGLDMDIENPNDEFDGNTIKGRLATLSERLFSTDDAVRAEADAEYAGLLLAQEYQENIKASINEERGLKNEMKEAAEAYRDGDLSRAGYNQFVEEAEKSLRENKIERIEAYRDLRAKMLDMMAGSAEARKEFTEREKQRIEEIHHLANSDMQGKSASPFQESTRVGRLANSSIVRFFAKPLATFEQMLRLFGEKNIVGEGYLFNKFVRGWVDASENAYLGEKQAKEELDAKVSEVFGKKMRWSDLYAEERRMARKMPAVKVKWWDGGGMKEHELTQGNLLYIYMVNKMTDGRMKLRRMGIEQEHVDAIVRQMDSRFIELADWLQGEYLVNKRNKYNEVHERLFGASMAAIEDYFPLKINKRSLNRAEDIGRPDFDDALPATTTGSIIKRKRNAQDLDLLGADAFSVVIEHVEQMERWAAFAEFNKDLNTLLSYKRFRNQVQNMVTVYGSGNELWNNFKSVCRIAGGTYSPAGKKSDLDTAALNIAKGVTSAKISFRVYTALKQFLSMPAFVSDANINYLGQNMATPWKAWNWAMENLPLFEKRWKSRMAGDTRLMNTESDWKFFRSQMYDTLSRLGMSPNAFVDALTVSIGSHSIYQTRYDRYIKDGYSEEQADKKAKQDATTLYNETQQSNEAAFTAPVQLDRTVLSTMLTVFRNSSMGYQRQLHDAIRNIGKMMTKGYKTQSIEFMKKQMMRDGLTEEQAEHAANRNYNREYMRSALRVATFGFLVQFAWNLGSSIAYLLFGDDDDKKEEMLKEAAVHALVGGSMEGLAGGNVMSEALNMVAKGESLSNYDPSLLPIVSDIKSTYKKMSYDPVAGANDLINLAVQAVLGVNPQTLTDAVVAVVDACGGDLDTSKEAMLLIMRVLQVPQSQADQIYIDELGMNAGKAKKLKVEEMARRYAIYKTEKGAPFIGWAYSDEAREKREQAYLKRFKKMVKERNTKE